MPEEIFVDKPKCGVFESHKQDKVPDFSNFPLTYVLPTHLPTEDLQKVEDVLNDGRAPLTYDAKEANLILGNISTAKRARLELRWKGVQLSEDTVSEDESCTTTKPKRKRTKLDDDAKSRSNHEARSNGREESDSTTTETSADESRTLSRLSISQTSGDAPNIKDRNALSFHASVFDKRVIVVRLEWLQKCLLANAFLPLDPFILCQGRLQSSETTRPQESFATPSIKPNPKVTAAKLGLERQATVPDKQAIVERAKTDERPRKRVFGRRDRIKEAADQDFKGRSYASSTQSAKALGGTSAITRPTHLLHQTTSEHDEVDEKPLPPLPAWIVQNKIYACERSTPAEQPNADFISQLKQIKLARVLTSDEIGVRAYSTSIAALAAYPYKIQSVKEILMLPGCDQKIAYLFQEYQSNGGQVQAVKDVESDPILKVLREFLEIWGVGPHTAREFYYDKNWRDLDDIIEFGWKSLNRVQQIGLKYYDDFQLKIPRAEVEQIANVISEHAKRITSPGVETIIVGGYRRGKVESGDVDVILSHPSQTMTFDLVSQVVRSLEKEDWITHTLTLNLTNSKRNQETLPINTATLRGHGFDTLDKALVVWQNPHWDTKESDLAANASAKNPNPHRRVDIIISPWKTVGCAVAGWTSGTTFQRDLRRYVKRVKGWKFDSSGVRDRATGNWIDLEKWKNEKTRCTDWKEAERRVFEGMRLEYREPWERCTW